jgi:hypothetical protein
MFITTWEGVVSLRWSKLSGGAAGFGIIPAIFAGKLVRAIGEFGFPTFALTWFWGSGDGGVRAINLLPSVAAAVRG